MNVLVETYYLATPQDRGDAEALVQYVRRLADLDDLVRDRRLRVIHSGRAWEVLYADGRLPPWSGSATDAYLFPGDVSTVFQSILQRSARIEDLTGVDDLLLGDVDAEPDRHLQSYGQEQRGDYFRMLTLWLSSGQGHPGTGVDAVVATGIATSQVVALRAEVLLLEPERPDDDGNPFQVAGQASHFRDCRHIGHAVSTAELLMAGELELALHVELARRRGQPEEWAYLNPSFIVRKEFLDAAEDLRFLTDRTRAQQLVRACTDVVAGERLEQARPLRIDEGGGAEQRVRGHDGAKAWRRDIDRFYRLHYWKCGDQVEFALVVPHDTFDIPD